MSSSKANILNRLRQSTNYTAQPLSSNWRAPQYNHEERFRRFKAALEAAHAEVIESSEDQWVEQLLSIANSKNLSTWLYNPSSKSGFTFQQAANNNSPSSISLVPYDQPIEQLKDTLFHHIDASLTEVQAGIAETGTLVMLPDSAEPRLMSLVPPVHVALFRESVLLDSFSELIEGQDWSTKGMPTNALLISGPSKTADIQQTLAYGAHGPKELVVLVIRDNGAR
ncbi:LutC/YkgG family protein [Alkalimarinus coralli]|uniref:LutC/YkgG family protein n=1 Tax=Alkalimarinus coralli TaxID=2935863 RepID=UPI00202AFC6B|nr:lactate utilization protein C [Alkalimarinus coralli]